MAKNFVQPGDTVTVTAQADVSSGGGVLVGQLFGVAQHDALSGGDVEIRTTGVWDLDKSTAAGSALTAGGLAYWDSANEVVTGAATGNTLIGAALAAAADGDAVGRVRLNGAAG